MLFTLSKWSLAQPFLSQIFGCFLYFPAFSKKGAENILLGAREQRSERVHVKKEEGGLPGAGPIRAHQGLDMFNPTSARLLQVESPAAVSTALVPTASLLHAPQHGMVQWFEGPAALNCSAPEGLPEGRPRVSLRGGCMRRVGEGRARRESLPCHLLCCVTYPLEPQYVGYKMGIMPSSWIAIRI